MSLSADIQQFQSLVQSGGASLAKAKQMVPSIKVGLVSMPTLPPCAVDSATGKNDRMMARSFLESLVLLNVQEDDMEEFERSVSQLKVYYADYMAELGESPLHYPILGMRLLSLLVDNRMAEFHGELENITDEGRSDQNIAFAIQLEQYLMEGSYSKVLENRKNPPNDCFQPFMSKLLDTVRFAVADGIEVSYERLSLSDTQKMMIFPSVSDLKQYVEQERPEWAIDDKSNELVFQPPAGNLGAKDIPAIPLVNQTLGYATELDRIV